MLIATLVGAKLVLDQSASAQAIRQEKIDAGKPQDRIVCWGNFDIEQGIAGLYPRQFGEVVSVAAENTQVKAGEPLLQVDDRMARWKVDEAKDDVQNSQQLVADAKLLPQLYELQAEGQSAAVRVVDLEIAKTQLDRQLKESTSEITPAQKKTLADYYDSALKLLGEKKKAEEAKLKQIKLQDAKIKIAQAEADLRVKETRLQEAQELVKYHRVEAPSDGTVLRAFTRKGEVLGPNPRIHALEFLPKAPIIVRAEVLQEWGTHVKVGKDVDIEDDTYKGPAWKGTVKSISKWYAPTRSPIIEPFRFNDVRTLECIIEVSGGEAHKYLGQRVRAKIKL